MTSRGHVLVVEDRSSLRLMLERALQGEGFRVTSAADGRQGIEIAQALAGELDLVLTDLKLPEAGGLEVLDAVRATRPGLPVIVLTAYGTIATAVEAMKRGAWSFLEKPVDLDDLFDLAAAAVGRQEAQETALEVPSAPPIVGRHPRLRAAVRLLERVAPKETTVLLTGASGTGKELFARACHGLSPRRDGPFVAFNCAALPESLVENELFGHEKGAFTGADRRSAGRFERARDGTLFLDEVGELAPAIQGKLLRVIEERTFERVGGGEPVEADVRLVAATNRNLETMVERGEFRSDLYFRLAVFPIELPSLSERPSDIPLLARHLLRRFAERHGDEPLIPTEEALELLAAQPWPGNVRELGNVLERTVILAEGPELTVADLEPLLGAWAGTPSPRDESGGPEVEGLSPRSVRRALLEAGGDKQAAARDLGVSYRTLQRRIRRWDLEGVGRYRR